MLQKYFARRTFLLNKISTAKQQQKKRERTTFPIRLHFSSQSQLCTHHAFMTLWILCSKFCSVYLLFVQLWWTLLWKKKKTFTPNLFLFPITKWALFYHISRETINRNIWLTVFLVVDRDFSSSWLFILIYIIN